MAPGASGSSNALARGRVNFAQDDGNCGKGLEGKATTEADSSASLRNDNGERCGFAVSEGLDNRLLVDLGGELAGGYFGEGSDEGGGVVEGLGPVEGET